MKWSTRDFTVVHNALRTSTHSAQRRWRIRKRFLPVNWRIYTPHALEQSYDDIDDLKDDPAENDTGRNGDYPRGDDATGNAPTNC
jgi:hypothetical protein